METFTESLILAVKGLLQKIKYYIFDKCAEKCSDILPEACRLKVIGLLIGWDPSVMAPVHAVQLKRSDFSDRSI